MAWYLVILGVLGCSGCRQLFGFEDPSRSIPSDSALAIDTPNDVPDDDDNDGIANADDNCIATSNPTQDNEDGDDFGDACDPCPPFVDTVPIVDTDGDTISDLCDPNPMTAGDVLVLFDGFAQGAPVGATLAGSWTFTNGNAVNVSSLNAVSTLSWPVPAGTSETIGTRVAIDEVFGTGINRAAGVIDSLDTTGRGLACEIGIDSNNVQKVLVVDTQTSAGAATNTPVGPGTEGTAIETRRNMTYRCASDLIATPLTFNSSFTPTQPVLALRTRSMSATFAWVLIIRSP